MFYKDKEKIYQERFDKFMELHPARNGRKIGRALAWRKFVKLSDKDSLLILQAVENYRDSEDLKGGIKACDPERFILRRGNVAWWREWLFKPLRTAFTPKTAQAPRGWPQKGIERNPNTKQVVAKVSEEMRENGVLRRKK